ncbi:glycosyltransferase family 2 protein [Thermococcus sp. AM4]|uniref:glycosyltransferase family 2 protein n=1 Tax=Thermococcus sp. (strain AM4) TaxID=246969 RepID=UPI00018710EA|nr:glycosyltransferase family 2 protein [Thermococcus sp. AM4]EEB73994.1 glycosyltransferase [Thermococcus sp. AM4]
MFPRVSIIILNWNGWMDTVECLESVYRIDYPSYDVIVVDNASQDESIEEIKEYAQGKLKVKSKFFDYNPKNKPIKVFELDEEEALKGKFNRPLYEKYDPDRRIILIKNRDNYGYAGGNNVGIKFALGVLNPKYVLILNPDTVVDPFMVRGLVGTAEKDKKAGILGPAVLYYDYNGRIDVVDFVGAFLIPWKGKEIRLGYRRPYSSLPKSPREVDKIEGSCMLVSKEVFHNIGLFDENFFCYWEETDLCIRAKKMGFTILVVPTAKIWHKISTSTGGYLGDFFTYHFYRNKFWFLRKNYPKSAFVAHVVYVILYEAPFKFAQLVLKHRKPKTFLKYLKALRDGLFKLTLSPI